MSREMMAPIDPHPLTRELRIMPANAIPASPHTEPALIDIQWVADRLGCSTRHVARLAKDGRMPSAVKLGRLCKWPREVIEAWIATGCPPVAAPASATPTKN